ncbi:MAG: glycosyltransferase family 2 protein [Nitrospirota bacterium]|nr:glycosyltransferase family 2 protein [Nitrospirota bacterium]
MNKMISVVIPNYNGGDTIGKCLEAAYASSYDNFEVIVVDDGSTDNSVEEIKKFPCRFIRLEKNSGASVARNTGALNSKGDIIFFTDSDCVMKEDALSIAAKAISEEGADAVIGGTYTRMPYDRRFFSIFQSIFVNYSEIKNPENPDYIATHAMAIDAGTFRKTGGFPEVFMPIIEDVEYSHRIRRAGYRLVMRPDMLVRHIFNYSMTISLANAVKKSRYWTIYSLNNKDVLADSGTASVELKANVATYFLGLLLLISWLFSGKTFFLLPLPLVIGFNLYINRNLIRAFYETNGIFFAVSAVIYYTMIYPLAVGVGAFIGIAQYFLKRGA